MKKQKSHAFGNDVYLLGKGFNGVYYWLLAPQWHCNWYWGFGYIETYTNNKYPYLSRDLQSCSHANDFLSKYFTEWNGNKPILACKTFTEAEGWELCELFESFYLLKNTAEFYGRGKSHVAPTCIDLKNKRLARKINEIELPLIMNRIIEILTPKCT
jgi:hypothetical protein